MLGTTSELPSLVLGGLRWDGDNFEEIGRGGLERWSRSGIRGLPGDGFPGDSLAGLALGEIAGLMLCLDDGEGMPESLTCLACPCVDLGASFLGVVSLVFGVCDFGLVVSGLLASIDEG
jgi:hypothetical protein